MSKDFTKKLKRSRTLKKLKNPINRNFKYEQNGNSKIEIPNLKFNIDIRKVAELAKKREVRGENLDKQDITELRDMKSVKISNRKAQETKLKAEIGDFVLIDGSNYTGYYHILDDGIVMTEAVNVNGKSQPLISKSDWIDNKETYLTISHKMEYRNPYRKRKLVKTRPKVSKRLGGKG